MLQNVWFQQLHSFRKYRRVKVCLYKNISSLSLKQDQSTWGKRYSFNKNGDNYHTLNSVYAEIFTHTVNP